MFEIHEQSEGGPRGDDATSLIDRHAKDSVSFSIERGEVLVVNHVCTGAEGYFCQWYAADNSEVHVAIGREAQHGLALTYDGGGNWLVVDSGCVIEREAAIAVVEAFMADGSRSEAVQWGTGVVRSTVADEKGWVLTEIGEPGGPNGRLPGGFRGEPVGAPDPELLQTATWRVLEELVVRDAQWLTVLAERPMTRLRRLVVRGAAELERLPAAVAALTELEGLVVLGPSVLTLPRLESTSLRRISLGLAEVGESVEVPDDWRARVEARLKDCALPRLESVEVELELEDGVRAEGDDDGP